MPGGVAPKVGSEKVSRYTGVSQLQLRVSRYTVQLRLNFSSEIENFKQDFFFNLWALRGLSERERSLSSAAN